MHDNIARFGGDPDNVTNASPSALTGRTTASLLAPGHHLSGSAPTSIRGADGVMHGRADVTFRS
ncbi:hypothetical protein [Streptomyces sp. HUAS TT7]|uniref:hypothetical protein n=1 Tax=Streptomyces sp. HUAS TT7 TaxID=3447507 RepID=UPI003F660411